MRKRLRWSLGLLAGFLMLLLLTACDEVAPETPSPGVQDDNGAVLSLPTRTILPIVSFTPRFTATLIPSITFTPSNTPTLTLTTVPPTLTPTSSPTLTPTVSGVIRSTENVNLREGPGTNYDIVLNASPGTELGVLGVQTDSQGREWYKVAVADDDDIIQYVWVISSLVETDFDDIVGEDATPPPAATEVASAPDTTATPTSTPEPNRVEILAYCQQKGIRPPRPASTDRVYVEWSWFVSRSEYMDEHLENANYEVRLDGELLDNWDRYATELALEDGVYFVYWYYPVGQLESGEHTVEFRLTWDEAINDGYDRFGPGTANEVDEGTCIFTVTES